MRRKKKVPFLLMAVSFGLTIVAVWFVIFKNKSGTLESKDFAIDDTASVTKIFLADKAQNQVTLEKINPGLWQVNSKYVARPDAINTLLYTMKNLEVKSPVGKKARENVIKALASGGIKVEVYKDDELVKLYYVGSETQDQTGTYMLLANPETGKNASQPFIMYIPGFEGYLTTRYFTSEADWRDRAIFKYIPPDLKSVKVIFPEKPAEGYEIKVLGTNSFAVQALGENARLEKIDTLAVKQYLSYYQNIHFEYIDQKLDRSKKDSITSSIPFCVISVTDKENKTTTVKIFPKPAREGMVDETGKALRYDVDRVYAWVNDKDLVVVQYFVFGKLLVSLDYFKAPVKK